jgi:hypothetical protein
MISSEVVVRVVIIYPDLLYLCIGYEISISLKFDAQNSFYPFGSQEVFWNMPMAMSHHGYQIKISQIKPGTWLVHSPKYLAAALMKSLITVLMFKSQFRFWKNITFFIDQITFSSVASITKFLLALNRHVCSQMSRVYESTMHPGVAKVPSYHQWL